MLNVFIVIVALVGNILLAIINTAVSKTKKVLLGIRKTLRKSYRPVVLKIVASKKRKSNKKIPVVTKESKPRKKFNWVLLKYFSLGFCVSLFLVTVPAVLYSWFLTLPSPEMLAKKSPPLPTRIVDVKGRLLYEIYQDKVADPVSIDKVPAHLINAVLAAEDANFYSHDGVEPVAVIRAAYQSLVKDNLQGGSTITQQLVKNVLLTPERTISRKTKELVLSIMAERTYSKDQLLEMYLNNISFGGVAIGVQAASQKYFAKNVSELSVSEAALLAGLPGAPTSYSPFLDFEAAKSRQKYVLDRMRTLGYLTDSQYEEELNRELHLADQKVFIRAPHFVAYVIDQLKEQYGERMLYTGGLTVKTSLDLDLQDQVAGALQDEIAKNGPKLNISNAASMVIDVQNSTILAYAGSIDYFKESWGSYDVLRAQRQPGSSIKPVTYSLALTKGFTAASVLNDSPVRYSQVGSPDYVPVNYDGKFHGNVTLRQALANSYNIPAVKLAAVLGPKNIVEFGKMLGLSSWNVDDAYGLSVTLGGKEVTMIELISVYATLAREGVHKDLNSIISVESASGDYLYAYKKQEGDRVLSNEVAYIISHILSDNSARSAAFGLNSGLNIPGYSVAVKTGTTDNKRDNWTFGYTPSFVVGVWVGNNDNTAMNRNLASGLSGASTIWNRITTHVLKNTAYYQKDFDMPDGVYVMVDKNCNGKSEVFIKGANNPSTLCPKEKEDNKDEKRAETTKPSNRSAF